MTITNSSFVALSTTGADGVPQQIWREAYGNHRGFRDVNGNHQFVLVCRTGVSNAAGHLWLATWATGNITGTPTYVSIATLGTFARFYSATQDSSGKVHIVI